MLNRPVVILRNLALLAAVPWAIDTARAQDVFSSQEPSLAESGADGTFPPELPPAASKSAQPAMPPPAVAGPALPAFPTANQGPAAPVYSGSPRWWRFWDRRQGASCDYAGGDFGYPCHGGGCGAPVPLGASLQATMGAQIQNGESAQMVLYHFDFCRNDSAMSARGRRQLARIAARLPAIAAPLLIQPTGDATLDNARREQVLDELATFPFPVPAERVRTGVSSVRELDGVDAVLIERKLQRLAPRAQDASGLGAGSFPPNIAPNR